MSGRTLLHRAWICFPRRRSSLCHSSMSQSNLWLQSSDPSPSHSIPVSGVSLGTKSHCEERMNATTAISVSHSSLATPLSLRAGTDPHRFFIQHKTTQDRTAGVLPIHKTLLHAPAVPACCGAAAGPAAPAELGCPREVPAALGSAQPDHRCLLLRYVATGPRAPAICSSWCLSPAAAQAAGIQGVNTWGFLQRKSPKKIGDKYHALNFH